MQINPQHQPYKYKPQYSVHSEYRSIFHEIIMKNIYRLFFIVVFVCFLGITEGIHAQQGNVIVPNVEGITLEVAAQLLRTTGLQPRMQGTSAPSGIVVRQYPRPGFSLAAGSEVTLSTGAVTIKAFPEISGSRALQQPTAPSGSRGVSNVTATGTIIVTPMKNIGTETSVASQTTSPQPYQTMMYQEPQEAQFTIFHHPQQAPANKNLLADTRPKKYPPWYPKEFLTQGSSQSMAARQPQAQRSGTSGQMQALPQNSGGASILVDTTPQWYVGWYYPQKWMPQSNYSTSSIPAQPSTPPVQETYTQAQIQPPATGSVPVPNLMRLRQQDAISAIRKAGLSVGRITHVQNSQWGGGLIMKQSPRARAIVQAGTQVDLWVAD